MFEPYTDSKTKYADKMREIHDSSSNKVKTTNNNNNTKHSSNTDSNTKSSSNHGYTWEDLFNNIFNKTSFFYLLLFLGIYIFIYFMLGIFFNKGGDNSGFELKLSRMLDFMFFILLLVVIISYLYSSNSETTKNTFSNSINNYLVYLMNPSSIITSFLFLVVLYLIIYLFRVPTDRNIKPIFISILETFGWLTFIIICIIDFFRFMLGIPIDILLYNFWNSLPDDHIVVDNSNNKINKKIDNSNNIIHDEVFNISNNIYTYDDAQSVCKVYGAKLATYDQLEDAYKNGAEWCNYGWSDNQMAYFPTQKSTWLKLQKDEKRKNNCGRPGINGGYMGNPNLKFGVNCFGKKPQPTPSDISRMNAQEISPKTPEDIKLDKKVEYWKQNADKLLQVNSYNRTKWSEY
uniref:Link domain-containing protein n=1 Tax=viral metagenome TaxID=1070528 RepID=A0A6C0DDM2_9ZZZZ